MILEPNMPDTFYRGAGRIGAFRGESHPPGPPPEDWIASTTSRYGRGTDGMTRLADGSLLADMIAADPVGWLGKEHVARHGADPALLVKLLDAGQRLPVHVHPDRQFAAKHLASPYGKTEAWIVLEAEPGAVVHMGFGRDVGAAELAGWVSRQDTGSMLAATNQVPVTAGDTMLCPAGTPHAIGAGILLIELQEPTDLSVVMEWRGFPLGPADVTPGLPMEEALACVSRQAWPSARLNALRGRPLNHAIGSLLPAAADPFFVAERVDCRVRAHLSAGCGVLVVTSGNGLLTDQGGASVPVSRGSTVLIPHSAGVCALTGDIRAVRCLPAQELGGTPAGSRPAPGRAQPRRARVAALAGLRLVAAGTRVIVLGGGKLSGVAIAAIVPSRAMTCSPVPVSSPPDALAPDRW
jgi:mannose-6-phosphate isomerase